MAVTYHIDLDDAGTITLVTSAEDLVSIHENPEIRRYIESALRRLVLTFVGTMRGPEPAQALKEFEDLFENFAQQRIDRIHQLETN
ncbi:MAG TPA: hypothetical protein VJ553_06175 [Candidatus Paceibacterota bacterium]|nr:hypothetical protein [Candidatus Paceibacterota bacterium]